VIEAAESGQRLPGGGSAIEQLTERLKDLQTQLDAANQDKDRLQAELDARVRATTGLSVRVDALGKQGNGSGKSDVQFSSAWHGELVKQINDLQQQLHVEREKNERLKGG
jgi:hypothetical protein